MPLRTKTGRDVIDAFERILAEQRCNMVQSDKGTEFLNSTFQSMLRRYDVKFYTSENEDIKAAVVERFNRTLKQKMYRYFTAKRTRRYVDVLPVCTRVQSRQHRSHKTFRVSVLHFYNTFFLTGPLGSHLVIGMAGGRFSRAKCL